jgi:hypothetical protein
MRRKERFIRIRSFWPVVDVQEAKYNISTMSSHLILSTLFHFHLVSIAVLSLLGVARDLTRFDA